MSHMREQGNRRFRRRWAVCGCTAVLALVLLVTWLVRWRATSDGPLVIAYGHEAGQQSPAETEWGREVAKACGCEIEWRDVTPESEEAQFANSLESYADNPQWSEPDVFVSFDAITSHDIIEATNGTEGYLDFRDYLDRMPNVSAYFRQVPQAHAAAQQEDGSIVSIPGDAGEEWDGSAVHMFVNRVWLDTLGLHVPRTWDELTSVLTAFRDRDPNGNGQADEIPLALRPTGQNPGDDPTQTTQYGFSNDGWHLLMNSTGVATQLNEHAGQNLYAVTDGKVWNYADSQQLRQVAGFLGELAGEGLIDKRVFMREYALEQWNAGMVDSAQGGGTPTSSVNPNVGQTFEEYEALLKADTPVAGVAFAFDTSAFGANADQYEPMAPPGGEPGVKPTWDYSARVRFNLSGVSVRASTQHLDQALKAVDTLFSEEVSLGQYYGDEGADVSHQGGHTRVSVTGDGTYPKGYGRAFVGWIRPGTVIENDKPRERYLAAEKPYADVWRRMDGDGVFPPAMHSSLSGTGIDSETDKWVSTQAFKARPGSTVDDKAWKDYLATIHDTGKEYEADTAQQRQEALADWQRLSDLYNGRLTNARP